MAIHRGVLRRRWPSRHRPEDGFTLVEILIALGVIFTTLLLMAFTLLSAFKSVGFSRQRTEATTLANQALEQIRALPADQLLLSSADPLSPADPLLLPLGCLTTAAATCTYQGRVAPKANFGSTPPTNPLVPSHVTTATASPGNTNYTISSYVTIDSTDLTGQTRIATIQVGWDHAQQTGVNASVQVESKLHTAPFTALAPGTHTYNATAQTLPGVISVTGTFLNQNAVDIHFPLPTTNAYMSGGIGGTNVGGGGAGQQVSASTASANLANVVKTPAVTATQSSAVGQGVNGPAAVTANPALSLPFNVSGSQSVSVFTLLGTLTAQLNAGSTDKADAIAASKATGGVSIPWVPSGLPSNNLGYGSSTATQSGPISVGLDLTGLNLLSIPLVSATPAGNATPDISTTAQTGTTAAPSQTFTANASKAFQQIDVLPTLGLLGVPVVRLSTWNASASTCASPTAGLCPSSTATSTGTLNILGVTTNLAGHAAGSLGVQTTTVNIGLVKLVVGANATIGSTTSGSPGSASVTSPLTVDVTLQLSTILAGTIANLTIHVDLGSITTAANYT